MPQHATTVADYCDLLARSRLIPDAEVRSLARQWGLDHGGAAGDVDGFRKYLVGKRCLTEYQAVLVQRGRPEGFFVGGYTILDRVGKGQSAGVFRAVHASGQVVALKVLSKSRAKDPAVLSRFQQEGRLLTRLDHPNVVRAYQVGQDGHLHFIAMEYVDGETLDEVLARRTAVPAAEAARLVRQALLGLQQLHERKIVHRDLKPANLMATPAPPPGGPDDTLSATVKVLDVGVGRELLDDTGTDESLRLTDEGTLLGTPDYLAPEQARDARSADIRSDVYSAGCVLYHLIAGRPPFVEKAVMAQMVKHATELPPPLDAPGVTPGLRAVVFRMTAKKPDDRYPSPAAAADALTPFLPPDAAPPAESTVLPAFRTWLQAESPSTAPVRVSVPSAAPPPAASKPATRPSAPAVMPVARPVPTPPPAAAATEEEINVELVALPPPAPPPAPVVVVREPEPRSPLDLNRRDFVLLGVGSAGVLAAVGVGYALAKVVRKPPADEPPPDHPADGDHSQAK